MVRVNNLAETDSSDNTAVKGLENKSQQSEKFGNIAVDSWKDLEKNYKDSTGKFGKNGSGKDGLTKEDLSKDGLSKDNSVLTFDDPFKKGKSDSSSTLQEKKMMSDEDAIRNKKEQAIDDANMIQKKKEAAGEDGNMIQKKKELADGGKFGGKVEGGLDFAPEKPKAPADGGLKEGWDKGNEFTGKKPLEGGPKDKEFTGKKPLDGGPKDLSFDKDFYLQML